jgi:hypothetical protein
LKIFNNRSYLKLILNDFTTNLEIILFWCYSAKYLFLCGSKFQDDCHHMAIFSTEPNWKLEEKIFEARNFIESKVYANSHCVVASSRVFLFFSSVDRKFKLADVSTGHIWKWYHMRIWIKKMGFFFYQKPRTCLNPSCAWISDKRKVSSWPLVNLVVLYIYYIAFFHWS